MKEEERERERDWDGQNVDREMDRTWIEKWTERG